MRKKTIYGEIIRFGLVGTTAAAIHYGTYWLLQHYIDVNIAYTVGYVVSFMVNYYLSARFTFREKRKAAILSSTCSWESRTRMAPACSIPFRWIRRSRGPAG